ncbi:MAG: response regulator [Bacteroidia bacterium]|nr:response regulator [Bacteroidia bacterium]MDW8158053.1 response regulator [Bacteroidia bacterium]
MTRPLVLCVDDDKTTLDVLILQLKDLLGRQFQYEIAESAEEAIELLVELQPTATQLALVVTDYLMQGQNGAKLILQLQPQFPSTPMILLSGLEKQFIPELQGIDIAIPLYVIPKPWEKKELQQALVLHFPLQNA